MAVSSATASKHTKVVEEGHVSPASFAPNGRCISTFDIPVHNRWVQCPRGRQANISTKGRPKRYGQTSGSRVAAGAPLAEPNAFLVGQPIPVFFFACCIVVTMIVFVIIRTVWAQRSKAHTLEEAKVQELVEKSKTPVTSPFIYLGKNGCLQKLHTKVCPRSRHRTICI